MLFCMLKYLTICGVVIYNKNMHACFYITGIQKTINNVITNSF